MRKSTEQAVDTLINGNIGVFKTWLKRARKVDILDAIEYHQNYGKRHEIINRMRTLLEN